MRRRQLVGSDGTVANVTSGLHDSLRGVDCGLQRAADGVTRCLPTGIPYYGGYYYSDANCTSPLVDYGSCYAKPSYAYAYSATCGETTWIIRQVDAEYTGQVYYGTPPTYCTTIARLANMTYYHLGPEVSPTSFVGFN